MVSATVAFEVAVISGDAPVVLVAEAVALSMMLSRMISQPPLRRRRMSGPAK
jgi:hypothetical protein